MTLLRWLCVWGLIGLLAGCQPSGDTDDSDDSTTESSVCSVVPDEADEDAPRIQATFTTTLGDFVVELFRDEAPLTVANFLRYARDGFYADTIVHRVEAGQYFLAGGFDTDGEAKTLDDTGPVPSESDNRLTNGIWTVAIARSPDDPDSATSQLIFNVTDNSKLFDRRPCDPDDANFATPDSVGYTVFGRVLDVDGGRDVVQSINTTSVSDRDGFRNRPTTDVVIQSVAVSTVRPVILGATEDLIVNEDSAANALALFSVGPNPASHVWTIKTQPAYGTVAISGKGASADAFYTPNPDFFGTDQFVVKITDEDDDTDTITIRATVNNVPEEENPRVRVTVADYGDMVIELLPDEVPITVSNFLQYVDDGFYSEKIWHRVIPDFVIQTGRYSEVNGVLVAADVRDEIPSEADGAPSNLRGTVAMALRSGEPDSGAEGFFINLVDNTSLNWDGSFGHTVFGEVVEGMDVADAIAQVATGNKNVENPDDPDNPTVFTDVPLTPVVITEIVRLTGPEILQGNVVSLTVDQDSEDNLLTLTATGESPASFTWSIQTQPSFGQASVEGVAPSAQASYTPNAHFFGSDSFVVQVTDDEGRTDAITVQVTVERVAGTSTHVRIRVKDFGDIVVRLFPDTTPVTAENFLRYVDDGFYNGKVWHRVVADFVIQAGQFTEEDGTLIGHDVRDPIAGEADGAPSNLRGTISMALFSEQPDSGAEGFFINLANNTNLDWDGSFGHTVFGEVVDGLDVVDDIGAVETESKPVDTDDDGETDDTYDDVPVDPVVITEIVRVVGPDITGEDPRTLTVDEDSEDNKVALNATGENPSAFTWTIWRKPSSGEATITGTGAAAEALYTPKADFTGADSFVARVTDDQGVSDIVTIDVEVGNLPDITLGDSVTLTVEEDSEDNVQNLSATGEEPDEFTWSIITAPTRGTATISGEGGSVEVLYTPNANFAGSDKIVVQVADTNGKTDKITINVAVEGLRILEGDTALLILGTGTHETVIALSATGDTPSTFLWELSSSPSQGTATITGSGASVEVGYTPESSSATGDSFAVQISDDEEHTHVIEIETTRSASAGIADYDTVFWSVDEESQDNLLTLTDDSSDTTDFEWTITTRPSNGTARITGNGASAELSYSPTADYAGGDSLVVQVTDGDEYTETVTINVTVNDLPDITEGDTVRLTVSQDSTDNLLELNATGEKPESFSWSIPTPPASGTATILATGGAAEVTFKPASGFSGTDSFVVRVTDERGHTDTITVQVTVNSLASANPRVRFRIANFGEFVVELFSQTTPNTVSNFLQYVDDGFYSGKVWHRVIADFMIQTGKYSEENGTLITHAVRDTIASEADGAPSNLRGTVSMALLSNQPDSGAEGFFINLVNNTYLDWDGSFGHTVFGEVVEGMDVVDAIGVVTTGSTPVDSGGTFDDVPVDPVVITEIVRE